jgi:1-aminocyclopropane-1-carboxylate deaminase
MEFETIINQQIPIVKVDDPFLHNKGISLFIKRDDLIHPQLSGNKWYKLKYNLEEARKNEFDTLLTFGGAYSNHIYAVAAAGILFNFKTIGIIRGESHYPLNPTLSFAKESGMILHYLDRTTYRKKHTGEVINSLKKKFGKFYLIPEGGTNEFAVKGCREILSFGEIDFDYVCCPCGTGGTLAGLITGLKEKQKALGFSVLKGAEFLNRNVKHLITTFSDKSYNNWQINLDYHFGGYARINRELLDFIIHFQLAAGIPIEPIYTGKMFYGIYDLVKKNFFKPGIKILAIHTGGMQGLAGLSEQTRRFRTAE